MEVSRGMAENKFPDKGFCGAVPIKANRVIDSCSFKECIENLNVSVQFPESTAISAVRINCVTISDVDVVATPVTFNKGFYSLNITYTVTLNICATNAATTPSSMVLVQGTASFSKTMILYGGCETAKTICTNDDAETVQPCGCCSGTPNVCVQSIDPMVLSYTFTPSQNIPVLTVTLGVMSIVEVTRPVTILVPTYPYSIPCKPCNTQAEDDVCSVFDRIQFPAGEFTNNNFDIPDCNSVNWQSCKGCKCSKSDFMSADFGKPPVPPESDSE